MITISVKCVFTGGATTCYVNGFVRVLVAGERGDRGEAGRPVPSHCVQHGDAGLQENPGESLSNGLEPQHVEHFVATAGSHTHTHKHRGPFCIQIPIHNKCSSVMFAFHSLFNLHVVT